MNLTFYKYQGTGNDFVIIDNRKLFFPKEDTTLISFLCDRKFGIGADGLILLEEDPSEDFKMVYYNSDGNLSSMCGNGGRCLVAFANHLGVIDKTASFNAVDGLHIASYNDGIVSLKMNDVDEIKSKPNAFYLDTGSPHHVQLVENVKEIDVKHEGAKLRYGLYGASGSNINFVTKLKDSSFAVRTYERGVEDETLSCGTGVTAVAIAMHNSGNTENNEVLIHTEGGDLNVSFDADKDYSNVCLIGPAKLVYKGEIVC